VTSRPASDQIARGLIEADQRSEAAVRAAIAGIPLGEINDVLAALAAMVNKQPIAVRRIGRPDHDPDQPIPERWDEEGLRWAHAVWARGHRDPWAKAGEHEYQRLRGRTYRAARREAHEAEESAGVDEVRAV